MGRPVMVKDREKVLTIPVVAGKKTALPFWKKRKTLFIAAPILAVLAAAVASLGTIPGSIAATVSSAAPVAANIAQAAANQSGNISLAESGGGANIQLEKLPPPPAADSAPKGSSSNPPAPVAGAPLKRATFVGQEWPVLKDILDNKKPYLTNLPAPMAPCFCDPNNSYEPDQLWWQKINGVYVTNGVWIKGADGQTFKADLSSPVFPPTRDTVTASNIQPGPIPSCS